MTKRREKAGPKEEQNEMFPAPSVTSLTDSDILASLSAWARGLGTDRETLRRTLLEHGVEHVAERSGHKLYAFRHIYQAWTADAGEQDPDKLKPFQRRAWYQGEREKLHLQVERGQLVDSLEMERTIGRLNQMYVRGLETAQDVIERDCGLTPQQAAKLEAHLDKVREDLYQMLAGKDPDETTEATEVSLPEPPKPAPKRARQKVPRETPAPAAVEDGIAFLRKALKRGARASRELIAEAKRAGLSEKTLRRAKKKLGKEVEAHRHGRGWRWQLARSAKRS